MSQPDAYPSSLAATERGATVAPWRSGCSQENRARCPVFLLGSFRLPRAPPSRAPAPLAVGLATLGGLPQVPEGRSKGALRGGADCRTRSQGRVGLWQSVLRLVRRHNTALARAHGPPPDLPLSTTQSSPSHQQRVKQTRARLERPQLRRRCLVAAARCA